MKGGGVENVRYPLKGDVEELVASKLAADLARMMYRLNAEDCLPLVAQFSRPHGVDGERCPHPDSVYGHLSESLRSVLRLLGVPSNRLDEAARDLVSGQEQIARVVHYYRTHH